MAPETTVYKSSIKIWDTPYNAKGWIPNLSNDQMPWIQIYYLYGGFRVSAIVTQGCGNSDTWVTKYNVSYKSIHGGNLSIPIQVRMRNIYIKSESPLPLTSTRNRSVRQK